jgi:hypothetical protein
MRFSHHQSDLGPRKQILRAGGLYNIGATKDKSDAEDGQKKTPGTKIALAVISRYKAIITNRGEWFDVALCRVISN